MTQMIRISGNSFLLMPKKKKSAKSTRTVATTSIIKKKEISIEIIDAESVPVVEKIVSPVEMLPSVDYRNTLHLPQKLAQKANLEDVEVNELLSRNPKIPSLTMNDSQKLLLQDTIHKIPSQNVSKDVVAVNYFRLIELGFSKELTRTYLEKYPNAYFEDLVSRICLEASIDDLPADWRESFEQMTVLDAVAPLRNALDSETDAHTRESSPSQSSQEVRQEEVLLESEHEQRKRWILENYQSESDTEELNSDSDQPNKIQLENQLMEIWKDVQYAKQRGEKKKQKELGSRLGKLRSTLVSLGTDVDALLSQVSLDVLSVEDPSPVDDEEGGFDLFTETESSFPSTQTVEIRDFSYRSAGSDVTQLLDEVVRKTQLKVLFDVKQTHTNGYSCRITLRSGSDTRHIETEYSLATALQAKEWCATKALFEWFPTKRYEKRLPPPFAALWNEWLEEAELQRRKQEWDEARDISEFLDSLPERTEQKSKEEIQSYDNSAFKSHRSAMIPSKHVWDSRKHARSNLERITWQLPVFQYYEQVVQSVALHPVVVISGETGSGKSTQIPNYLLRFAVENCSPFGLICTQVVPTDVASSNFRYFFGRACQ
jgi:hypothetical protein